MTDYEVLVVDDRPELRRMVRRACERFVPMITGLEVNLREADSAEAALALMAEAQPHFLLMDTEMGSGMPGFEACADARTRWNGSIYIVGMSAGDYRAEWNRAGANQFLLKPYGLGDLKNELEEAWEYYASKQ